MTDNTRHLFEIARPSVTINGLQARFPVRRIFCVGRNYAAHTREMGGDPQREPPFFFSKPADAICEETTLRYPSRTADLHHEVEMVVALGESLADKGKNLSFEEARAAIFGYAVGIDLTRRDLQAEAKELGRPWDTAKGFDQSALIAAVTPASEAGDMGTANISLRVNGELRQQGNTADMIWSTSELIAELSTFFRLCPGDLIYTGTPAGVAALQPGDVLEARLGNLSILKLKVTA